MDEKARIHHIIDDLNFPPERYVLGGSGVMILQGIERKPRDLDLFCATATWFSVLRRHSGATGWWNVFTPDPDDSTTRCDPPYLFREMYGLDVNVFFHWRQRGVGDIDTAFWIHNSQMIEGIPCVPLEMILAWKDAMSRAKDAQDIELIRKHLEDHPTHA